MKGSGGFDRRHILSINYIYELPIFRQAGFAHSVLGGWEVAGTIIDETGIPGTPRTNINYDTIGLGGGYTNRPNVSGKVARLGSKTRLQHGLAAPIRALEAQARMPFLNPTV